MRSTSNTDQLSWRPRVLYDGRIVDGFRLHADRVATLDRRVEGQEHGPSPEVVAAVLIESFEAYPEAESDVLPARYPR